MRPGVYKIDNELYKIKYKDLGILRPENKGLWRAEKVDWRSEHWSTIDDADYLITDDGCIVAMETGWELRRHTVSQNKRPPN